MRESTKQEQIEYQYSRFMLYAIRHRLDIRGDSLRFFSLKTARAWTAWLRKAI